MWFNNQVQSFENTRFGTMSWMIIVQCCLGGIVGAMELAHDHFILLSITAALAMGTNTMFIAQAPGKYCVGAFYLSIIFNGLIGAWYLLM